MLQIMDINCFTKEILYVYVYYLSYSSNLEAISDNINKCVSQKLVRRPQFKLTHNLPLFYSVRIPRQPYLGHDNLKIELEFFLIINSHYHFIFLKMNRRTPSQKI